MANAIKWSSVSSASVATTELDGAIDGSYKLGTEFDNGTTKAQYGKIRIYLGSLTPASGGYLGVFMKTAPDGTTYDDAASENPGAHKLIATIPLDTGAETKVVTTGIFQLEPFKTKFVLYNKAGVSLAGTTNTMTLYYWNDEIQ